MEQKCLRATLIRVRVLAVACLLTILSILLFSFKAQQKVADDVWKMIGMTKKAGEEGIYNSFLYGYLSYYGAGNIKKIAMGDRAQVAKDLLAYTKQYVNSESFRKAYASYRLAGMPQEPTLKTVRTKEQVQKDEIAKTEKILKETEENMKQLSADLKKSLEGVVILYKNQLKEYQNVNNPIFESIIQGEKYDNESAVKNYESNMARWKKDLPEDPTEIIRQRLQKMLDLTKDVDYNAELVEKYGKKRFVKPEYERKGTEWKQAFRAGKEVTEISRTFVEQWLKEMKTAKATASAKP